MSATVTSSQRIALIAKGAGPYWDMLNQGFLDAARRFGVEPVLRAPTRENLAIQAAMFREQLEDGVDAIAFVATDPTRFNNLAAEAKARQMPVVSLDLDAPESRRDLYVGTSPPEELGREAGRVMACHLQRGQKVAVQTGSTTAPGAMGKLAGFVEVMAAHGVVVVGGDDDRENEATAHQHAHRYLQEHPDLAGMFGVYAYHPGVQVRALKEVGRERQVAVVGFDMVPETVVALRDGSVNASLWVQEYYFGFHAATILALMLRIGTELTHQLLGIPPGLRASFLVPTRIFTSENVTEFEAWRSQHTREKHAYR